MGSLSMNWRPDYTPALMRRELDIIRTGLYANAVRLGGRDPRRLLAAAGYAASAGLNVWLGPELWNATPRRTLSYLTEVAAAAEPLSTAARSATAPCRSSASTGTTSMS
jgi:hypothetical protein